MWDGRFSKATAELMEDFNASIGFDSRLYKQDIRGSIAHARMLARQGIIPVEDMEKIVAGLQGIEADLEAGKLDFTVAAEDVHMNIETFLTERIGDAGKRLHTARSRNDQVALDVRLYLRDEITEIRGLLLAFMTTLADLADAHKETIMPGYTHLQKAQPITLAHHLMAYFEMTRRDLDRLDCTAKRLDFMPLGSGALAGTGFPIDRHQVRDELGFAALTRNSLDGVSDRDFAIDFLAFAAMLMLHLSRFSEEIILWASDEFRFIDLDDEYSTGSSIMPQKKNPDVAELVRGKTGRVYGDLITLLTLMKGLPLAYNKDMQEDKEALFDGIDTVKKCLMIFKPMLETATFRIDVMRRSAARGFTNATDLADYLVDKGMPFREAHAVVGRIVADCAAKGEAIENLPLAALQAFSSLIGEDVYPAIDLLECVRKRSLPGGPAPVATAAAIAEARQFLKEAGK